MSEKAANAVVQALITQIRECADEATIVAKAADKLAKRGHIERASTVLMDIEGPIFEIQEVFRTIMSIKQRLPNKNTGRPNTLAHPSTASR